MPSEELRDAFSSWRDMAAETAAAADAALSPKADGETALVVAGDSSVKGLLAIAKKHGVKGEHEEAVALAEEALALARGGEDKSDEAMALCALSEEQCRSGSILMALETAKQMRVFCHQARLIDGEVQALVQISKAHLAERQAKPAVRAATAAVKLATKGVDAEAKLMALLTLIEGSLQLLGVYSAATVVDARLQNEIDDLSSKSFAASSEASKLVDVVDDMSLRAQAFHWIARTLLIFTGMEKNGLEAASKARYLAQKVKDEPLEAETLLVLAQAHHKVDPKSEWISGNAHDALEIFQRLEDEPGKDRTFQVFQELGIALRVAGGSGLAALPSAPTPGEVAPAPATASEVALNPKGLDPEDVMGTVQEMAKAAIGLDEALYLDSPLMDSGMDSLTAVSFRNGLQQNLGVKLPSSLMFDYPTMKEVANRIVELSLEDE